MPCTAKVGTTITGKIQFIAEKDEEELDCEIYAEEIGGASGHFPWVCPERDGCQSMNVDITGNGCPLEQGKLYLYEVAMEILPSFPTVSKFMTFLII